MSEPEPQTAGPVEADGSSDRLRRVGLWLGLAAALAAFAAGHDLSAPQRTLSAIMALCAVWWVSEPIPMAATALVAATACVLLGVAPAKQAFAAFGNPLLFLFVGSFFIAEAMKVHGLGRRLAAGLARVARGRLSLLCALSGSTWLLSMWMSNTAATAVALPIAIAAAHTTGDRRFGMALVLAVAWGASVGGIATPVGTPPNLIGIGAMREAGFDIGFLRWMTLSLPIAALMLLALWLLFGSVLGVRRGQSLAPNSGAAAGQPWKRGEKAVLIALGGAIAAWLAPGVLDLVAPGAAFTEWVGAHLTEEVVALLAGCSLFALPAGAPGQRRPALTWSEAARIDWGVILLFGGGLLLGDLARTSGLSTVWGEALITFTGADALWTLTALTTGAAILLSEATSNTATATLIVPLTISLAEAAGVSPLPPALGATMGASFGFMLPISTPPNAMAYATGLVRVPQMVRAGVLFDVLGFAIIVAGLRLLCPLLGLV